MKNKDSKKFKFTIGADPEFNIEFNGKRIHAEKIFSKIYSKDKQYKQERDGFTSSGKYGNFGWDGHSATGEIRVAPSKNPAHFASNLKNIIQEMTKNLNNVTYTTLCSSSAVGGHFHFLLPEGTTDSKVKNIHKKMVPFIIPLIHGENKINQKTRLSSGYGGLDGSSKSDAFRVHVISDKVRTYELRTLTAEWLTTPKLAEATAAYLTVVYNEIINNPDNYSKHSKDIIFSTVDLAMAMQQISLSQFSFVIDNLNKKIKSILKKFELYEEYKDQIEYIFNYKQIIKDKEEVEYDLLKGWIGTKKKEIVTKKAFSTKKNDIEVDESLLEMVNIYYNKDVNVSMFATETAKRIIALQMKNNKTFFFFGVRKGINERLVISPKGEILLGDGQCKTTSDINALKEIAEKMKNTALSKIPREDGKQIDIMTGKIIERKREIYCIGIPYEERQKSPAKSFFELIYDLENDKILFEAKKEDYINDNELPEDQKGEIYKIINKDKVEEFIQSAIIDKTSNIQDAINNLTSEAIEQERLLNTPRPIDIGTELTIEQVEELIINNEF